MLDLGIVRPGSTVRIPFSSFDKDDGSSITMTNYAAADLLVYKDGNTTERASTAGFTATTDFDGKTGKHLAILDLADNTTAGFWNAGSEYLVAVDAVTIDAVTTGGWIARFRIGYPGALFDTTIATLASQTSFTLTAGPAEDDALNGAVVMIHDLASAVQCGLALVLDYTGASKTVTLAVGTTFTAAAGDNISILPRYDTAFFGGAAGTFTGGRPEVNTTHAAGTAWGSGAITAASIAADAITAAKIADNAIDAGSIAADAITAAKIADGAIDAATFAAGAINAAAIAADAITAAKIADGAIDAATFAAGAITASAIAADAIGASELAADAVAEIADQVWDEATAGHVGAGSFGKLAADVLEDTGTTLQGEVDGIQADTEDIQTRIPAALTADGNIKADTLRVGGTLQTAGDIIGDTNDLQTRIPAALVGGRMDSSVGAMAANVLTASALNADAVDEILDEAVGDGAITMRQALRVLIAGMAGKLSGAATATVTIRNLADAADVIVATVDSDGNRSNVVVTP